MYSPSKNLGSAHKAAMLSNGQSVLPNKHSMQSSISDSRTSSINKPSSRSIQAAHDKIPSYRRTASPSPGRRGTTSPRHGSEKTSLLDRQTSPTAGTPTRPGYQAHTQHKDKAAQQQKSPSPMVARHSSQPPPYQLPKYIGYTSSTLPADYTTKKYGIASERRPPSSPIHQRRSSIDVGESQARQKRRDEKSCSGSQAVPDSPSMLRKHISDSSDYLSRTRRGDSVADCLNYQSPVTNSFHQSKNQYKSYGYSSDIVSSKTSTMADGEVRRSTLHLDPISSQESVRTMDRMTATSPTSYYTVRSRYGDKTSSDTTTKTSDSKLPPIVSPTVIATSSKSQERVRRLLNNYICQIEMSKQKYLDSLELSYVRGGIVGLPNVGNTCYMNSVLQCLSHTLEMTHFFLTHSFKNGLCSDYKDLLGKIWLKKETSIHSVSSPSHKWYAPVGVVNHEAMRTFKRRFSSTSTQFMGFAQHDAQEFLLHFISRIHSEVKKPTPAPVPELCKSSHERDPKIWKISSDAEDNSPISDFFQGEFESCLQCGTCKNKTILHDQYWDIGLPVFEVPPGRASVSIYKCLSVFENDEHMQGNNKPYCDKCKMLCNSSLRMSIHRLPPLLCVYLKRFDWSNPRFPRKLNTSVEIPYHLDLTSCCTPTLSASKKMSYELYGVTNHMGTLFAGHYTASVRHYASQEWFNCNDLHVDKSHQMSSSKSTFTSKDAYVLFYRRTEASFDS